MDKGALSAILVDTNSKDPQKQAKNGRADCTRGTLCSNGSQNVE